MTPAGAPGRRGLVRALALALGVAAGMAVAACDSSTPGGVARATEQAVVCQGVEAARCEEFRTVASGELVAGAAVSRTVVERIEPGDGRFCQTDGCTPVADVTFELMGGTTVTVRVVSVAGQLATEDPS